MTRISELESAVRRPEGCTEFRIAAQTATGGTIGYEDKIRIFGLEEITFTYNYVEGAAFSDNQQDTYRRKASSVDIEVKLRQLSAKAEALMMGKKFLNGIKVTNTNDKNPTWDISYVQTNSDNSTTYREFYNCTISREEGTNKTIKDGIEYDVTTLKIKALPLPNGDIDIEFDNDAEGITEEILTEFKTKVIMPPTPNSPASKGIIITVDENKEKEKKELVK